MRSFASRKLVDLFDVTLAFPPSRCRFRVLDFASTGVNGKVSSRAEGEKMLRISESDITGKESSGEKKSDMLNKLDTNINSLATSDERSKK